MSGGQSSTTVPSQAQSANIGVDKTSSLQQLATVAQQLERHLASPLVVIGNDGSKTVLSFDLTKPAPTNSIQLVLTTDPAPPNTTKVSNGNCFVSSNLAGVTAYRPK